jgi:hypothetical protein
MICGKTLTVLTVAWGKELPLAEKVLNHCATCFPSFDSVVLYKEIDNLLDYNKFMVEGLSSIINTDFVLIVQPDGFIINSNLWQDKFLEYDYIGAPWPWHGVCGNGGFSLRSKRFLDLSSRLKYDHRHEEYDFCPEDNFLCLEKYNRNYFLQNQIKFADIKTSIEFSFEHPIKEYPDHKLFNSFGFHGKHLIQN